MQLNRDFKGFVNGELIGGVDELEVWLKARTPVAD
jgi:hypothetical protein